MELKTGTLLKHGEYRIEKVLGQGGFGITYLACQVSLGRKVAVKEFFMKDLCNRDDNTSLVSVPSVGSRETVESFRHKFIKEARLIASFNNGNIIHIHDVFEDNGTAYYVMEYIDGKNLSSIVAERGALDEATAVRYVRQVSNALADIHNRNLLHLDVKPANIMLNAQGDVVLIDFGASKHYDSAGSQTSSTPLCLSEGYAPLEQYEAGALRSFTSATDIYALGATLFTLVTGVRPPRAGDVMNEGLPVLPNEISSTVRATIEAAMQPRRKDRPQSIAEFLAMLTGNGEATKDLEDPKDTKEETRIVPKDLRDPKGSNDPTEETKRPNEETRIVAKDFKDSKVPEIVAFIIATVVLVGVVMGLVYRNVSLLNEENNDNNSNTSSYTSNNDSNSDSNVDAEEQRAREEAERIAAEQAATEEQARLEREAEAQRQREQQQGISASKKVDLGLSVCWAAWNIGASSPKDCGDYYAWGETSTKDNFTEASYKYYRNRGYVNIGKNICGTRYDVARAKWGSGWRLPTQEEYQELIDRCEWTWTTYNGVPGYDVTGPNGNSIFLPAAKYKLGSEISDRMGVSGYYWSGTFDEADEDYARCLSFDSSSYFVIDCYHHSRWVGFTIRPVCDK